jgi:hypothetical protein
MTETETETTTTKTTKGLRFEAGKTYRGKGAKLVTRTVQTMVENGLVDVLESKTSKAGEVSTRTLRLKLTAMRSWCGGEYQPEKTVNA